jgi:uncharacterized protein YraI
MTHRSTPPTRRFTVPSAVRFKVSLAAPLAAICLTAGLSLTATDALAQSEAYTSEPVDLYAGPSGEYPVVTELGPNVPVTVMGCVSDYSWCDVAMPGMRGWVYGAYLTYPYQGGYVPLTNYGAVIGLPIVTFSIGAYWGSFYRDRPWYGQRDHWAHVPPPGYGGHPPGPPPPMHGGPQGGPGRPPMQQGGRPPGPQGNGAPPPGAGRPPAPGNGEPPQGGRPPMNGGERAEAPRPPMNAGGPPPGAGNQPHAPMPQQNNAPRPAAPPQAPAFNHAAPPQMQGGGRPAGPGGPPAEHGREGQGGGGHDDRHQPN